MNSPNDLLVLRAARADVQDMREATIEARAKLDSAMFFASRRDGITESLVAEDVFTAERWLAGIQTRVAKTLALLAPLTERMEREQEEARAGVVDEAPSSEKPRGE